MCLLAVNSSTLFTAGEKCGGPFSKNQSLLFVRLKDILAF